MDSIKYTLDRLDYNENKINEALKEIKDLRDALVLDKEEIPVNISMLLKDEKYRMITAISLSKTNIEASIMLGISERSFYRKIKEYNIDTNITCEDI